MVFKDETDDAMAARGVAEEWQKVCFDIEQLVGCTGSYVSHKVRSDLITVNRSQP